MTHVSTRPILALLALLLSSSFSLAAYGQDGDPFHFLPAQPEFIGGVSIERMRDSGDTAILAHLNTGLAAELQQVRLDIVADIDSIVVGATGDGSNAASSVLVVTGRFNVAAIEQTIETSEGIEATQQGLYRYLTWTQDGGTIVHVLVGNTEIVVCEPLYSANILNVANGLAGIPMRGAIADQWASVRADAQIAFATSGQFLSDPSMSFVRGSGSFAEGFRADVVMGTSSPQAAADASNELLIAWRTFMAEPNMAQFGGTQLAAGLSAVPNGNDVYTTLVVSEETVELIQAFIGAMSSELDL